MSESTIPFQRPPNRREDGPASGSDAVGSLVSSPTSERYILLHELARGGMGIVFAARDLALRRTVAVKVLRPEFERQPMVAQRFLEEARITGQLQHPGIPPVHNLGTLPDGRPFLAMKLIEGQTLARRLKARPDPSHDLPPLLHVFEQVSQTVAYAHARNVIHRDLKPSNVMVGSFGEVQVMDWGVAKVLGEQSSPATAGEGSTDHPLDPTLVGDPTRPLPDEGVMGTLAYMPPEQARGDADVTDARSDVFALGGMLCELLTGAPPFTGTQTTIRELARAGDLRPAFARLDACGADGELVALAKRCLSPDPNDRPPDAGAVALAIATYRTGVEHRLRKAEVERAEAAVRESERGKRRRVQLALAVAALLLLLGVGASAWLQDRQARERQAEKLREDARNWEAISARLTEVEAALRADDLPAANAALARVASWLQPETPEYLRNQHAGLARDRDMVAALEILNDPHRTDRPAENGLLRDIDAQDYAEVFGRYGLDLHAGDPAQMAERIHHSPIRTQLLNGLDAALSHYGFSAAAIPRLLPEVLRRVDGNPIRNEVRDAVFARDSLRLLTLVRKLEAPHLTPGFTVLLVGQQFGLPPPERLRVLTAAYDRHPSNFRLNQLLCLLHLGSVGEKVRAASVGSLVAATTHARILISLRPHSPTGYRLLSSALRRAGQLDGAIDALRRAVELAQVPDEVCSLKFQIGAVIGKKSGPDAALAYFRAEVDRAPRDAYAHWNLGRALQAQTKPDEALACFRRAIDLLPTEGAFYRVAAQLLREQGELDEAVRVYRLAGEHARPPRWSHIAGLGPLLLYQEKYREAVQAQERLMAEFPKSTRALGTLVRYDAACAVARAGTTGGIDPPPPADRPALRRKALNWLREDLAASRVEFAVDPQRTRAAANDRMRKWIDEPHLVHVRHPLLLTLLPPDEAKEWFALWDDVHKFRDQTAPAPLAPPPREVNGVQ